MYFKKIIVLLILFNSFMVIDGKNEILVDKLVAVVKDTVITFSDIEKAVLLYPVLRRKDDSEKIFYRQILSKLIDYRVIFLEYSGLFILTESDYEKVQLQIIKKAGSMQKLNLILKSFDMKWNDFREFIKEKVFYEKIIREKFQFNISIYFKEVEKFYNKEYVPMQRQLGLTPKSLFEMTPIIKNYLRQMETGKKIVNWLRDIKNSYNIRILPIL